MHPLQTCQGPQAPAESAAGKLSPKAPHQLRSQSAALEVQERGCYHTDLHHHIVVFVLPDGLMSCMRHLTLQVKR